MRNGKKSNRKVIDRARLTKRPANFSKQSIRGSVPGITFEALEDRQLMTVINVADFGARPNDGQNDVPAIKAALNASKPGDTILFSGGVFDLSGFDGSSEGNGLTLSGDRTYKGQNGATLNGHDVNGPQIYIHGNNVTFQGFTLTGGGVKVDGNNGYATNITIDSNVFKLDTGGVNPNGITANSGLRNSVVSNNYFTGYHAHFGIYGYGRDHLIVRNNEFVNISAGIHMESFNANDADTVFEQNYFTGMKGMGIELQRYGLRTIIQDNWYEHPNLSTNFGSNTYSMAYSLILERSTDTIARRNVVIAPERPDGVGTRIGIEIGGDNALVEDNYMNGVNHTVAQNDATGSSSATVRNNQFMNFLEGVALSFPGPDRTMVATNNGPNVTLSATMRNRIANNQKPGIGAKRYDGTGTNTGPTPTPTPTPAPTPTPTPTPTPAPVPAETSPADPTSLLAMVTGATTVNLFWTDKSTNETGYRVERSTDGTNWTLVTTLGADAAGYTVTGLTAGQEYSFRVRATNAAGKSHYSNTATATPDAFDPAKGTYLSDLTPASATNYWGDVEKDMSNGEQKAADGRAITIADKTYAKGLGVHAGSEIHYVLDGNYTKFTSDIGIDDETEGEGSVVFEVWADGQKLYSSGAMTAATSPQSISVDVTGKQELVLKVTNADGSYDFDHADWANAKLIKASTTPPVVDPVIPTGETVNLSDLDWDSVSNGWGTPELDKSNGERGSNDGHTLTLDGKEYEKGIGAHSASDIRYRLQGKYSTFTADIGVDDEVGNFGSVVFQVIGDGVVLYDSGVMTGADATKSINVNVSGVQELSLVVTNAGDDKDFDHADWANAKLVTAPASTAPTTSTQLSSLTATSQSNGWGQVETNTSVGEEFAGDGKTLTINGKTYTDGLGAHSDSKIVYQLNGQYTTFVADLGIDDEVGNNGSVAFQVWTDGTKVYDSGVLTGADAAKAATVNVAGKNEMWLVVTNAGDDFYFDHADWAGARLLS